jgi:hypothetical protein
MTERSTAQRRQASAAQHSTALHTTHSTVLHSIAHGRRARNVLASSNESACAFSTHTHTHSSQANPHLYICVLANQRSGPPPPPGMSGFCFCCQSQAAFRSPVSTMMPPSLSSCSRRIWSPSAVYFGHCVALPPGLGSPAEKCLFPLNFSLCLSRACLGKMITFSA